MSTGVRQTSLLAGFLTIALLFAWLGIGGGASLPLEEVNGGASGGEHKAPPGTRFHHHDSTADSPGGLVSGSTVAPAVLKGRLSGKTGGVADVAVEVIARSPSGESNTSHARTSPDGVFKIAFGRSVTVRKVVFSSTATTPGFSVTLATELRPGKVTKREFYLPLAAEITATVLDTNGSELQSLDVLVWAWTMNHGAKVPAAPPTRRLVTSANGTVRFPAPSEVCYALAQGSDHVPVAANQQQRLMDHRASAEMRLVVARSETWTFRVVSPTRSPVVAAEVTAQPAWSLDREPLALSPTSGARLPPAESAATGSDGTASLRLAKGFAYHVTVRSRFFATWEGRVTGGEAPERIELQEGFALPGVVTTTTGTPVADAVIAISGTNRRTTRTDAHGIYELRAMSRRGKDIVSVRAPGFIRRSIRIDLKDENLTRLDVLLTASETATGQVVDHHGRVARGVWVILADPFDPEESGPVRDARVQHSTRTDSAGRFRIPGLSPGEHDVVVAYGRNGELQLRDTITTRSSKRITLLDPEAVGSVIFGRVTDAAAKTSIPIFSILAQRVRGGLKTGTRTNFDDDDGEYRLLGLPVGQVELQIEAPGYAVKRITNLNLSRGARRLDVKVHAKRRATFKLQEGIPAPNGVDLRFFDSDGCPVLVDSNEGESVQVVRLTHGRPVSVSGLPICVVKVVAQMYPNGEQRHQFVDLQAVDDVIRILVPR